MNDIGLDRTAVRRAAPAELFVLPRFVTLGKALLLIAVSAALFAAVALLPQTALRLALGAVLGVVLFALGVIGHESGHLTASRHPWFNDLAGLLSMSLVGLPARGWKVYHDLHHRHTGVPGLDTDAQYTVAQYAGLPARARKTMRWVCEHEFLFWPLAIPILGGICWSYAIGIVQRPDAWSARVRRWNRADMAVSLAFTLALFGYGLAFGAAAFACGVLLPLAVAGVLGSATLTTNHRNLPPLSAGQARAVRHHFHRNTRTLTFPRWLPGNWFTGYVPWQIEHHLFPTVAGRQLARLSPYVRAHAAERGIALAYEGFFSSALDVARTRHAWGADGRLHSFESIDRALAAGKAPEQLPGYAAESRSVARRDLRDLLGLR